MADRPRLFLEALLAEVHPGHLRDHVVAEEEGGGFQRRGIIGRDEEVGAEQAADPLQVDAVGRGATVIVPRHGEVVHAGEARRGAGAVQHHHMVGQAGADPFLQHVAPDAADA